MSTKARRIKLAETLAGQQIFWTPSFSGDQYGDLTKQRKIISGTQPRSPVLGLHSRTLLFITSFLQAVGCPENLPEWHICAMFRRLVAMFLSDTSEFGWCHSTPRSRWDSTRSSCCLLTAHLLTQPGKLGVRLSFERAVAENWTHFVHLHCQTKTLPAPRKGSIRESRPKIRLSQNGNH